MLGRNIKLTLNDKEFVVLIFSAFPPHLFVNSTPLLKSSLKCLYSQLGFER